MKTSQAYYHQGKFWFNEKGWPVRPVKGFNAAHYVSARMEYDVAVLEYEEALTTALAEAVEFEDQEAIKTIVAWDYQTRVSGGYSLKTFKMVCEEDEEFKRMWLTNPGEEGLYTIPEIEVKTLFREIGDGELVARIIQPAQEESQETLIWEFIDAFIKLQDSDKLAVPELTKRFTISRKP
jgi:hypothetical protein